jgi:excisionase family DNA binding protein
MVEERRWISTHECADYLGLHFMTIYKLIARGEIPAAKIGGAVRIDLARLQRELENQKGKHKK